MDAEGPFSPCRFDLPGYEFVVHDPRFRTAKSILKRRPTRDSQMNDSATRESMLFTELIKSPVPVGIVAENNASRGQLPVRLLEFERHVLIRMIAIVEEEVDGLQRINQSWKYFPRVAKVELPRRP
jgi:hypothetical protein